MSNSNNDNSQPQKKWVLENPTDEVLDRILLMGDREHKDLSVCQVSIPPRATMDLGNLLPDVASGRVVPLRMASPGRTLDEVVEICAQHGVHFKDASTHVPGVFLACNGAIIQNLNPERMLVTVWLGTRQPGPNGRYTSWDELIELPAKGEVKLPPELVAEYVLPGDSEPEDIRAILKQDYEFVGEIGPDGVVRKRRGRKKGQRKSRRKRDVG